MAKSNANAVKGSDAAKKAQDEQEMSQDVQEAESQGTDTVAQETAQGVEDAELKDGVLVSYAVKAKGGLRLREGPSLDAPVIGVLPCGAGVFGDSGPAENDWRQVFTGRLSGWMMDERLEVLPLPDLGHADG